ncbi:MAG: polysaccharide deacetylase family protein [Cyclobacteriaceae bacterium]
MGGIFTISLDFELHWGGFDKWPLKTDKRSDQLGAKPGKNYHDYFLSTRRVIPEILSLFETYDVHATWATVGMLLHDGKEQLLKNAPEQKPTYLALELSAYNYINKYGIGDSEGSDPVHFAPSLVTNILNARNQELATHSFSHFYCNERGQTLQQFREDIRAAKRAMAMFNAKCHSLVFPRNQFNDDYLRVCFEEGIRSVRSNPMDWFWNIKSTQSESILKRLNRGIDAYFPVGKKKSYKLDDINVREGLPICLPSSRLLRPYRPSEIFLNHLKIDRVKSEMIRAAKSGEVYHLWWHPHNFSDFPQESLAGLTTILECFASCRDRFDMKTLTMAETATLISHNLW